MDDETKLKIFQHKEPFSLPVRCNMKTVYSTYAESIVNEAPQINDDDIMYKPRGKPRNNSQMFLTKTM